MTWDGQMLFFGQRGYRVIAHDRRGHGRSSQTWDGNEMDTYADDLAALFETLDLKERHHGRAFHRRRRGRALSRPPRHQACRQGGADQRRAAANAEDGEKPRRPARSRSSTASGPHWRPIGRSFTRTSRSRFTATTGRAQRSRKASASSWWLQGMMGGVKAHYDCIKAFSETDFTEDLKKIDIPDAGDAWRRRSDRADRRVRSAVRENSQESYTQGLSGLSARHGDDQRGPDQRRSARVHPSVATTNNWGSVVKKIQVNSAGGSFELIEERMREPGARNVRVRVQACGICHSDALTKEGGWPGIVYPRSPGHEIAGVIDAVGEALSLGKSAIG